MRIFFLIMMSMTFGAEYQCIWKSIIGHLPKLFNICSYWANLASSCHQCVGAQATRHFCRVVLEAMRHKGEITGWEWTPPLRLSEVSYSHKHCFQFPARHRNCGAILFSRQVWEKAVSSWHYVLRWLHFIAKFTLHICLRILPWLLFCWIHFHSRQNLSCHHV